MALGSLSEFLEVGVHSVSSISGESYASTPGRVKPVQRHSSLADYFANQLKSYDNSTDNGLYVPSRVDVVKSIQQIDSSFTTPPSHAKPSCLPSYRFVHSRVSSFRERKSTASGDYSGDVSKLRELEMRNEMMLAGRHNVLRTMKKELRKDTQDKPRPTMAEQFQMRLTNRIRKLAHPGDTRKIWKCEGKKLFQKPTILHSRDASLRAQSISSTKWQSARSKASVTPKSHKSIASKTIFQVLDLDDSERVSKDKLVWLMLALGVRLDPHLVFAALRNFFPADPPKLHLPQWVKFVGDTSNLPTVLQRLVSVSLHLHTCEKPNDLFISRLEQEFERLFLIWERIQDSWKAIDPISTGSAMIEKAAQQFVILGVAVEARIGMKIATKMASSATIIRKSEFLAFFIRPLLKLHMDALDRVMQICFGDDIGTLGQKLMEATRIMIMAGLDYKPEKCRFAKSVVERLREFDKTQFETYAEYKKFIEGFLKPKPQQREEEVRLSVTPSPEPTSQKSASPIPLKPGKYTSKRVSTACISSPSDQFSAMNASTLVTTQSQNSSQHPSPAPASRSPHKPLLSIPGNEPPRHRRVRHAALLTASSPGSGPFCGVQSSRDKSQVEEELLSEFDRYMNKAPYPSLSLFLA